QAHERPLPRLQCLHIAQCLRLLQHAESKLGAWDIDVHVVLARYLQENASRRTALVQLPSRVQEARPITYRRRRARRVTDRPAQIRQQPVVLLTTAAVAPA